MSLVSTWVRCRNGMLYRNPVLSFTEGFVCFDDEEPPEIVLWISEEEARGERLIEPCVGTVLDRVFGVKPFGYYSYNRQSIRCKRIAQRVVPRSDPWAFRHAVAYFFDLDGRIPEPLFHEGEELHVGRIAQGYVVDFPASPYDPYGLTFDE